MIWLLATLIAGTAGLAVSAAQDSNTDVLAQSTRFSRGRLMRVELRLVPQATRQAHLLLMTLGGPVYCGQLLKLARRFDALLACPDYGRNGETSAASRARRMEDWGDPTYLNAVAALPARLQAAGLRISALVLVGPSYAGYADTELVATHPRLHVRALIVIDSFLDLAARYRALPPSQQTRKEITTVLGGTLAQHPATYAARSPSHHLRGLATAIRRGMHLVTVWSIGPREQREFNHATCSQTATAHWLSQLATLLHKPLQSHVTQLPHDAALRYWGTDLLALAGIGHPKGLLPARTYTFLPGGPPPEGSYCPPPLSPNDAPG